MAFVCALSNEVPETPVVSPVSGSVFEKRLIEKYIQENGPKDPINGERLELKQLIELKPASFLKSKAPTHTSIPAILKSLQDEWDATMLYSFTMKQQLQTALQELSHCLYQHDAACRVVARLSTELSKAREALAILKPQQAEHRNGAKGMNGDEQDKEQAGLSNLNEVLGISVEIKMQLHETAALLTQGRKAKAKIIPPSLASLEDVMNYQMVASLTGLHSPSSPGIMCLDVQNEWIVTGGNDKMVSIYDQASKTIVTSLKGHTKKVMNVACLQDEKLVVSGSMDSTAKVWHVPTSRCIQTINAHKMAITGLSVHPTKDYLLLSSLDEHWSFVDLESGAIYARVRGDDGESEPGMAITSAKFHPDGLIFATGTFGADVKVWDVKEQQNVATFTGHGGTVVAVTFSENGYYLATAANDASVKLWDLRKLKNFKTIQMEPGFKITDVTFDFSGSYLALAGSDVRVYACRSWSEVSIFGEHTATATGVRFGNDARWIASTSMDRSCKIYSVQETQL